MREEMKIRAHHGMCLSFFEGKGYSDTFTKHMGDVRKVLETDPVICLAAEDDVICRKCPNLENGRCLTAEKVRTYDEQVLKRCGLQENQQIRWKTFHKLVEENILGPGRRKEICGGCQWEKICAGKENGQKNS